MVCSLESANTVRCVRGFAVKPYIYEGNYEIVENDLLVSFIRDGIRYKVPLPYPCY